MAASSSRSPGLADAFEPNVVINTTPAAGTAIDSNTVNVVFADSFE